jgi:hypothetical protein
VVLVAAVMLVVVVVLVAAVVLVAVGSGVGGAYASVKYPQLITHRHSVIPTPNSEHAAR